MKYLCILHDPKETDGLYIGMSNESITLSPVVMVSRGDLGIFAIGDDHNSKYPQYEDYMEAARKLMLLASNLNEGSLK